MADYLSYLSNEKFQRKKREIEDGFSVDQLFCIEIKEPWYANIINSFVCKTWPQDFNSQHRKKLFYEYRFYRWDEPFLHKLGLEKILRLCVPEYKITEILAKCYEAPYGGNFGGQKTVSKTLQSG